MRTARIQNEHFRAHADQQQLMPPQPETGPESIMELIKPQ